ncbi:MAG: hypothetical protein ACI4XA_03235 [Oscillospiraceae bacterium]
MKTFRKLTAAILTSLIAVTSVTACDESSGIASGGSSDGVPNNTTPASTTSGVPSTMKEEDAKFDKLGAMISAGDSPDFYSAADLDMFPKGAIYNMFEPMDQ